MSATACGDMPAAVISFLRLVDCGFGCRYAGAGDTDQKRDVGCTYGCKRHDPASLAHA